MINNMTNDMSDSKKKIFSCVVSYRNPKHLEIALQSQKKMVVPDGYQLDIFIVDNSVQSELLPILKDLSKKYQAQLILMKENLGVSGAYAHSCKIVLSQGYHYMWLWDQDSIPPDNCLKELLGTYEREFAKQKFHQNFFKNLSILKPLGMVGPRLLDPDGIDKFYAFFNPPYDLNKMRRLRFPMEKIESGEVETTYLVNSGTLITQEVIEKVGGPDTDFFMDLVDFEYSSKVVANGFRLLINANTTVNHRVGDPKPFKIGSIILFGRNYPPFRYYYQARNDMLLARRAPSPLIVSYLMFWRVFWRGVRIFLTEENAFSKLTANYMGWLDGVIGKKGLTHSKWMMKR